MRLMPDFAYELPALAESLEQCIAEAEKDLNSFVAGLPSLGAEYKDFNDYAAYALWTGLVPFKGLELPGQQNGRPEDIQP